MVAFLQPRDHALVVLSWLAGEWCSFASRIERQERQKEAAKAERRKSHDSYVCRWPQEPDQSSPPSKLQEEQCVSIFRLGHLASPCSQIAVPGYFSSPGGHRLQCHETSVYVQRFGYIIVSGLLPIIKLPAICILLITGCFTHSSCDPNHVLFVN